MQQAPRRSRRLDSRLIVGSKWGSHRIITALGFLALGY
jgi:hypothetical protein